jgi:hypothetical protein
MLRPINATPACPAGRQQAPYSSNTAGHIKNPPEESGGDTTKNTSLKMASLERKIFRHATTSWLVGLLALQESVDRADLCLIFVVFGYFVTTVEILDGSGIAI